jgi:hypothetical protein
MDDWVVSCRVDEVSLRGKPARRGSAPSEASCCPCETCLSDVEGGGLLADGQT